MDNIKKEESTVNKISNGMQKSKDFIKETLYIVVISLIIVLPIRAFIAQPFIVSGASMDNTFQNGNYLIVDEISYRFNAPKRGEVIVLKAPPSALAIQKEATTKNIDYIKRIIGLPGETVEVNGDEIKIFNTENPEGKILNESYVYIDKNSTSTASTLFSNIKLKVTLKDGEYFVLGDNRHNSSDSRLWGILPRQNIVGKTYLRLFPFNKIQIAPGEHTGY